MSTNTAKKPTTKTTAKTDMSKKIDQIKATAQTLNIQIREVATDAVETVVETGKQRIDETTKRVKKVMEDVTVENGVKTIKTTAKNINDYSLEVADDIVEGALATGKEWQGVAEKALKGSLKLANKQQEIIFDALQDVKGQVVKGAGRVRNLITNAEQN
ncbi:MAG: hypothetical protein AAGJ93_12840 [Bacteroidota bacterium]